MPLLLGIDLEGGPTSPLEVGGDVDPLGSAASVPSFFLFTTISSSETSGSFAAVLSGPFATASIRSSVSNGLFSAVLTIFEASLLVFVRGPAGRRYERLEKKRGDTIFGFFRVFLQYFFFVRRIRSRDPLRESRLMETPRTRCVEDERKLRDDFYSRGTRIRVQGPVLLDNTYHDRRRTVSGSGRTRRAFSSP